LKDLSKKDHNGRLVKRKPILFVIVPLLLIFIWLEFQLFSFASGKKLPIYFFGLVNFNLIILLGFGFYIFRTVFKAFVGKKRGILGNSLKSRLIASFLGFSIIPTFLMFLIAFTYISSSFDRWFNDRMMGVLQSAIEIKNEFYDSEKKRNFTSGFVLREILDESQSVLEWGDKIKAFRKSHSLDFIELYKNLEVERALFQRQDAVLPILAPVEKNTLSRVLRQRLELTEILTLERGHLVRVLVPLKSQEGVLGISTFVSSSLVDKMEDVAVAYSETQDINYPVKSIYLIFLVLMTAMILGFSIYAGISIAKNLAGTIERLGDATRKVARGNYQPVEVLGSETEVQEFTDNFNLMVQALETSREETTEANKSLRLTLKELDQRRKYTQVVLENVNTGVISFDQNNKITMINDKAAALLNRNSEGLIGTPASELLGEKYFRLFKQMIVKMSVHNLPSIQRQIILDIDKKSVPTLLKISGLVGSDGSSLGKVVVFDDLSDVLQAQRAVAWKEVARRIAHEVKNPLTPIKLSAQRLQKKFPDQMSDDVFQTCTNMIIEQSDSLKLLINEFSQFARLPETRPQLGSLNDMVHRVLNFYRQAHPEIEFIGQLDQKLRPFFFDGEQMRRALINLVENSVDAVKGKVKAIIKIETKRDSSSSVVSLSVSDNGKDLSEIELQRMFEPYFTKKEDGAGLGLTIVKKIVEDHDGIVRVEAKQPVGLYTSLELPYGNP